MERYSCSWIRCNIAKMGTLPQLIDKVNALLIKSPADISVETDKLILKLIWKCKGPGTAKNICKGGTKLEHSYFSVSNIYYKATVSKKVWCWYRHTDQRSRTESLEINPHVYIQNLA